MRKSLIKFSFLSVFCFSLAKVHGEVLPPCLEELQKHIGESDDQLAQQYLQRGGAEARMRAGDRSVLKVGTSTKEAVLVMHGFVSSPQGLSALIEQQNSEGFTVYAPLIPGFGSTPRV